MRREEMRFGDCDDEPGEDRKRSSCLRVRLWSWSRGIPEACSRRSRCWKRKRKKIKIKIKIIGFRWIRRDTHGSNSIREPFTRTSGRRILWPAESILDVESVPSDCLTVIVTLLDLKNFCDQAGPPREREGVMSGTSRRQRQWKRSREGDGR